MIGTKPETQFSRPRKETERMIKLEPITARMFGVSWNTEICSTYDTTMSNTRMKLTITGLHMDSDLFSKTKADTPAQFILSIIFTISAFIAKSYLSKLFSKISQHVGMWPNG